jgi:hypothetical protein
MNPTIAIIRDGFGTERDRFEVFGACDPVAVYATNHNVPLVRLREAGWSFELIDGETHAAQDRNMEKMPLKLKGRKVFGSQSCDSCGREFTAAEKRWDCPHCGFDNKIGEERPSHLGRVANEKKANYRKGRST